MKPRNHIWQTNVRILLRHEQIGNCLDNLPRMVVFIRLKRELSVYFCATLCDFMLPRSLFQTSCVSLLNGGF